MISDNKLCMLFSIFSIFYAFFNSLRFIVLEVFAFAQGVILLAVLFIFMLFIFVNAGFF